MKFYIGARYGRRDEALSLAEKLEGLGHRVTSTWVRQVEDEMLYDQGPDVAGQFAQKDIREVEECDVFVALSEEETNPYGRGGRHVEFGAALVLFKVICVIGPLENLFHYHPHVANYETADHFIEDYRSA